MKQRSKSKEDKRMSRFHQMEQMEAAARGTAPSLTLDMGDIFAESTRSHTPPPATITTGRYEETLPTTMETFGDRQENFLPPLVITHRPATSAGSHLPISTGDFFSQRERYEVDQSINLMDTSSMRYSIGDHGHHHHDYAAYTTRHSASSRKAYFIDIFMGGSGTTSGSGSSSKGNAITTWRSSTLGKILVVCFLLAFLALLTLSVPFLLATDNEASASNGEEDTSATTGSLETNAETVATVENVGRFEKLKSALLEQQKTTADRLQDTSSSAFHALRWLTDDDAAQLSFKDPQLPARFALASLYYATCSAEPQHASTERQVMDVAWTRADGWLSQGSVCTWYGVDCASEDKEKDQKVVHLNVTHNGLEGTIPLELESLTDLILLDLSNNQLSGSIPSRIAASLTRLKYLLLHNNVLSGKIPGELEPLHSINEIHLSFNKLTGTIPDSVTKLSSLRALHLANNQLSGSIPDVTGLKDISKYLALFAVDCLLRRKADNDATSLAVY
jgi:Leucine-rich repeat (LRR) protein